MSNLYTRLNAEFHKKCYEPIERNHDGVRFHGHRFPIKGGISWREVMVRQMMRPNPSLKMLKAKTGD